MQSTIPVVSFSISAVAILIAVALKPMNSYAWNLQDIDLKLNSRVSESYDDNVTYVNTNKKSDFITNLTIGIGLKYEGKTTALALTGGVTRHIFTDNRDFNNSSEDLTLNFRNEFSKYDRLRLANTFVHAEEPRSFEDAFGRTAGRYSYYKNKLNLTYTRDVARYLKAKVIYSNEIDNFSREDISDSSFNKIGCELDYVLTPKTIILSSYSFAVRDFKQGADASTHTLALGLRRYITTQLYFDGRAGVDFINSYNNQTYQKSLIFAALTDDIDRASHLTLSFVKEYHTNSYSQDIFNYWQVSGSFTKQLLERLSCSLSNFYGEGKYISLDIKDKFVGSSIAFTYDISANLKANLTYAYSNVDSTLNTREYTKNIVTVGLTIEF